MRPQWFSLSAGVTSAGTDSEFPPIPYDRMWEADHLWLPLLLEKRVFITRTDFIREGDADVLQKWWIGMRDGL
jgi:hypothetical protein